jgi:AraC family transcriptional regulator of adaptative response/methylated-DNA-[protein]-cysteine methyltransferase
MKIGYTVVKSLLGRLLVAATPRGICSVMLGDSESDLTRELQQKFSGAQLEKDDENLRLQARTLLACLAGQAPHPDLALDIRGSAFQMRVWEELRRIPRGQRISYGELARRIGRPKSARAVARACATNPLAILTPCHRVVRENGDLGGYRWGIERKRRLLEQERD